MLRQQISQLRRRKVDLYRAMLPGGVLPPPPAGEIMDLDYASILMAVSTAGPPDFALRVGAGRRIADLGILGHVTMSCATLGEVAEIWKHHADAAGELIRMEWSLMDRPAGTPVWKLGFVPLPFLPRAAAHFCVDEMCAAFFAFAREITGEAFGDFAVRLPHGRDDRVDYAGYFPGEVSFGHSEAAIVGPADALDLPIRTHDPETFHVLVDHFKRQDPSVAQAGPTRLLLYDHLARRRGLTPSVTSAAAALGTSVRTLSRRLEAEGTRFGAVLDDFRRAYALALLEEGTLRPKQIAHAIGFRNENCLRRAFRRWTGRPIGEWRREHARPA